MVGRRGMRATRSARAARKRVEEIFGWLKTIGQLRKLHHRGLALVNWIFLLRTTAYNLIRMRNLQEASA